MHSLLVILLLCLCVHACNARHLGITDEETTDRFHLLTEEVRKAKPHKLSTPSRLKPSISVELPGQAEETVLKGEGDERKRYESWGGADTMKATDFQTWGETQVTKGTGNEILASSLLEGLQQATKLLVGWKNRTRSLLAFTSHETEETVNSKENDVVEEDIVVMDYAQPHRKPPIHNQKP